MRPRHLRVLQDVLSQPTAPFVEQAVIEHVRRWSAGKPVKFSQDAAGNVLLRYRKGPAARRCWVFAAHMDHPGFVARSRRGRKLQAEFRGGLDRKCFPSSRVEFTWAGGSARGTVTSAKPIKGSSFLACAIDLDGPADVPAGCAGMWLLPAMRVRGSRLSSRACDDLVGAASVLCALEEIIASGLRTDVIGFLSRAEEAGFIGALAAASAGSLPRQGRIVAIETSKAQPAARLGSGVIVRVGDRSRTFDPSLTAHVARLAAQLARDDPAFRFSRQLMPGGTCESTAYALWGYQAAALCVGLGNYHNHGPADRVAAEQIDLGDFECLVKLLVALAGDATKPEDTDKVLRDRLQGLLTSHRKLLSDPLAK